MCKKVLMSGIAGGIVFFIWSSFSWMVLPWHAATMHNFKNSQQVTRVLSRNVDASGIYVIPSMPNMKKKSTKEREISRSRFERSIAKGPLAFVAFSKEGADPTYKKQLGLWLATLLIGATLISSLLWCGKDSMSYTCRVGFIVTIGIIVGFLSSMPGIVWWHHSIEYAAVNFFDDVIGWSLAGLVMAKIMSPKRASDA